MFLCKYCHVSLLITKYYSTSHIIGITVWVYYFLRCYCICYLMTFSNTFAESSATTAVPSKWLFLKISKWLNLMNTFKGIKLMNHWIIKRKSPFIKPYSFLLSLSFVGTATWSWRMWRRCGQKFPRAGRGKRSLSPWIRTATFPRCSWGATLSLSCWEILWSRENELLALRHSGLFLFFSSLERFEGSGLCELCFWVLLLDTCTPSWNWNLVSAKWMFRLFREAIRYNSAWFCFVYKSLLSFFNLIIKVMNSWVVQVFTLFYPSPSKSSLAELVGCILESFDKNVSFSGYSCRPPCTPLPHPTVTLSLSPDGI